MGLFSGIESSSSIKVEGFTAANDQDKVAYFDFVGPDYFKVLGVPLLLGREISTQDQEGAPVVAVINESMAKFYFKNENPVGRKLWMDDEEHRNKPILVVGVTKDARDRNLRGEVRRRFYLSITQPEDALGHVIFEIRTVGDPEAVSNSVISELKNFNSAIPINSVRSLDYLVNNTISNEIIIAKLSSFFGGLALVLACVGLYGIMSYTVNGRTKEIGVRMALGAQRKNVLWLILREAMILVIAGIAVGIPAAIASTKLISSMLYGLSGTDPVSMAVVILILGLIAVFASYIPARRATKVDPMVALRYE
jgi:predicted permease